MARKLWQFHGGLHLPGHKEESTTRVVEAAPLSKRLTLPLQQHIGNPAELLVAVGDKVLKGQMIAKADGFISSPVHAPTSGTVVEIGELPVPHPSQLSAPCVVIETDGEDTCAPHQPVEDYKALDPSALRNLLRDAGIVGLGGAGFPSYVKLNPGSHDVETLILNAAECEPYITCDDMLMREQPDAILQGLLIMRHALRARHCIIGIEDNKPQAYAALSEALQRLAPDATDIEIVQVPTRYPTGGEKQLIKVLTGKEVPSHGLPIQVGVVCHNVATTASIYRAVIHGEPLLSRIVTITGDGVAEPRNLEVRFGTPIHDLLEACGAQLDRLKQVLMGGPMMGFPLRDTSLPVIKTTNCILTTSEIKKTPAVMPCIRCGACAEACPVTLLPQQMYWHARAKDLDKVQDYNLFDCIECGCCAYVCPSNIPLVQYYRFAKTEIWAQEREKTKADLARQRHEFRLERQEREKAERAARHAKKKASVKPAAGDKKDDDAKKAAIQAALERAKAKKAATAAEPKNTDNLTEAQQKQIAEADERRAAATEQTTDNAAKEENKDMA